MRSLPTVITLASLLAATSAVRSDDVSRVFPAGDGPRDARLTQPRNLRDAYHPWAPATDRGEWDEQAQRIREQALIAAGLWPMPDKTPLDAVVHGRIERGDYTVEKVYFASRPGHYVTGNLYRPKQADGKIPGVLCPHGHWPNGRFYDAGPEKAAGQLANGAEKFLSGARFPLQARMVQLARLGCVVFHYDMVGYADSKVLDHSTGFNDAQAELRIQNKLGLQTWNSIRALDFLISLPEVDADRIGVTGASGGGTQTFMLCAIDERPAVAFPAVMVSTAMQGGCVCENASCLRHDINNIALAALFAPRPMALSGADDWTIDIETKGLPELKQVYSLYGKADLVNAVCYPQFQHNYNGVAREMMLAWFNQHLNLDNKPATRQSDFWPIPPEQLTVFNEEHPVPDDAKTAAELRADMITEQDAQFAALAADESARYREIVAPAVRVLLDDGVPGEGQIEFTARGETQIGAGQLIKGHCGRPGTGEQIPVIVLIPEGFRGDAIAWFDEQGKSHLLDDEGDPTDSVVNLLDAGHVVIAADPFLTGEFAASDYERPLVDANYPGYTLGYNRPLLAERVRDIVTVITGAAAHDDVERVHLVGTGEAGPWALLAAAVARDIISSATVDLNGFSFNNVSDPNDPMLLPGGLRYGDIGGLAAIAAPRPLTVFCATSDSKESGLHVLQQVYQAADGKLQLEPDSLTPQAVVEQFTQ